MPTGIHKTPAERRADELIKAIERNVQELHRLVYAGQEDHRRVEKIKAELDGGVVRVGPMRAPGAAATQPASAR